MSQQESKTKEESARERFLNQRSDKFTIILNDNALCHFLSAHNVFTKLMTTDGLDIIYIACIRHDRDYDEVAKHVKTLHYHVVLQLGKICRVGTLLNTIRKVFEVDENQITLDKCNSIVMQSRYLMHLDDFDKAEYYKSEVVTNDRDVLERYCNLVIVRDIHDLIGVVKHYHYNLEEIMQNVAHYDKWRKYINDLIINEFRRGRY